MSSAPSQASVRNASLHTLSTVMSDNLRKALAGPVAILVLIPVLVATVAIVITLSAYGNQKKNVLQLAEARFRSEAERTKKEVLDAMMHGDAVLTVLRRFIEQHGMDFDKKDFVAVMDGQFEGRKLLAYVGVADTSGTYQGIYYQSEDVNDTRRALTERRIQENGKTHLRDYSIDGSELTIFRDDNEHSYDPRTRPWFIQAKSAGERITSDPYAFFDSGVFGVTVAEPFYSDEGEFLGVLEMDFKLNSFSRFVEQLQQKTGEEVMIFTSEGHIVAQAGFFQEGKINQQGAGQVSTIKDVTDPLFKAYFDQWRGLDAGDEAFDLTVAEHPYKGLTLHIDMPGEPVWHVVVLGSLLEMLETTRRSMIQGLFVAAAATFTSLILALLFARHIVNTHLRVQRAERDASRARKQAREMGAYNLYTLLGEGGMGEVWLAMHRMLARPVALKLIKDSYWEIASQEERRKVIGRFEREARAIAQLQSRHTIQIFDFGVTGKQEVFYVMELLDGLDLYHLVGRFGAQPFGRVKPILLRAAQSLPEAHSRKLIHRDIKPANIYLCRQAGEFDLVKVLDFGMVGLMQDDKAAEASEESTQLTMGEKIQGTPSYMAPEQAVREDDLLGERTDLYALALVGWHLLTGEHLFERETHVATLIAQCKEPVPDLSEHIEGTLPPGLGDFLRTCLEKVPSRRPRDMQSFIEQLEAIPVPESEQWTLEMEQEWWSTIPPADFDSLAQEHQDDQRSLHKQNRSRGASSSATLLPH